LTSTTVPWLGGKSDLVAILESGEDLGMRICHLEKYPEVIWMGFPHSLLGLPFHERYKEHVDVFKAKNCCFEHPSVVYL